MADGIAKAKTGRFIKDTLKALVDETPLVAPTPPTITATVPEVPLSSAAPTVLPLAAVTITSPPLQVSSSPAIQWEVLPQVQAWVSLSLSPLSADDGLSSLHRQYRGSITAERSDGVMAEVLFTTSHRGDPSLVVEDLRKAFADLEIYRLCSCSKTVPCSLHAARRMAKAAGG
jgi:hypothetical protein